MAAATLLLFNLATPGAPASPGPALIAMIRSSFIGGRREGLGTGPGLSLAAITRTALSLGAVFRAVSAYLLLEFAGAARLTANMILTTAPMRAGYTWLGSGFDRGAALLLGKEATRIAI